MRTLVAMMLVAAACGGPKSKQESALVPEGSDVSTTCCCKTIPETAEKEIVPNYAIVGRMDCSTQKGECVDDVQCNAVPNSNTGEGGTPPGTGGAGNPPPPPDLPSSDN
jgi:hypothetical protein